MATFPFAKMDFRNSHHVMKLSVSEERGDICVSHDRTDELAVPLTWWECRSP